MEKSPAECGRRANTVVERKLGELCAALESALSPPWPRSPEAERRLVKEIKTRTDFLRSLLVAEGECHGGGERPAYLVEAEERFAVLESTFDQWARRGVDAPAAEEEMDQGQPEEKDGRSGSECSCTDSCQEAAGGVEDVADRVASEPPMNVTVTSDSNAADKKRDSVVTREEASPDAVAMKREMEVPLEEATSDASAKKRDTEHRSAAETKRSTVQRRWWRRSATWCGAAGVVAVVAVGLAVELAAVAHHNVSVYVVPT